MLSEFETFFSDESGVTAIEYALIASLILSSLHYRRRPACRHAGQQRVRRGRLVSVQSGNGIRDFAIIPLVISSSCVGRSRASGLQRLAIAGKGLATRGKRGR